MKAKIKKHRKRQMITYWSAAASVLTFAILTSIILMRQPDIKPEITPYISQESKNATLTLGNGQVIPINKKENLRLLTQSGIQITEDTVRYVSEPDTQPPTLNKLSIPAKEKYMLVLSDGTRVWLNAGSTVEFYTTFRDSIREVKLNGEAYFDVVKSSKPFIVKTAKMDITVLGTSFNLCCFADEEYAHATLKTGKIKIRTATKETLLTPGLQAYVTADSLNVRYVNIKPYTSWMGDRLYFSDETLENVMHKLGRWYDFQATFDDPLLKKRYFSGSIPKYEDIEQVLHVLKMTTNLDFMICDKTITVIQK